LGASTGTITSSAYWTLRTGYGTSAAFLARAFLIRDEISGFPDNLTGAGFGIAAASVALRVASAIDYVLIFFIFFDKN